jgi:phosphoglycerate kinase
MNSIGDYSFNGKKAIVRVDFNVPMDAELIVTDESRILAAVPTIQKILDDGGSVILMSHLGRPKEGPTNKYSLQHIVNNLKNILKKNVQFVDDCIGKEAKEMCKQLQRGEILLLENLRFYKEEEKGDAGFAKKLAGLADVYVNDAFGTAHRAHASTSIIAQFFLPENKMAGFCMESEIKNAAKVLSNPLRPFTAIIGGAKVSDKILIIEKLLDTVDALIIGGGMAFTFLKSQGFEIGKSICEMDKLDKANELLKLAKAKNVEILLPIDVVLANEFANDAEIIELKTSEIPSNLMGLDIGSNTVNLFEAVIEQSKTILWNGPMGVFEMKSFENGTKKVAEAIVRATSNGSFSLIGGGDSAAAIHQFNFEKQVSYVSTGGGALLEYFEGKELPGIAALN